MTRTPEQPLAGPNYASARFGAPSQWIEHVLHHPRRGDVEGKVFLGGTLALTGMEVSLGTLLPGAAQPFLHAHRQNEELYLFLSGEVEMQVDGQIIPVAAGSAVRIAPEGMRGWRNTGQEPLNFVVVQAKAGSLEQATAQDGRLGEQAPVW